MQRIHSDDASIESKIQAAGKTAPRITPADVEAAIVSESYFTAADGMRFQWLVDDHSDPEQRDAVRRIAESIPTMAYGGACLDIDLNSNGVVRPELALLTFCVLVLKNGFTVTGESACASPENFDAQIGRDVARQNAVNKIWPLLGYMLKDELHRRAAFDAEPKTGDAQWLAAADEARAGGYASQMKVSQLVADFAGQPPCDNAHVAPGCEKFTDSITFDGFVQYGRDNGANIVRGMPWSFSYKGHPVTHENDQRYIVGAHPNQVDFTPGQLLITSADGKLSVIAAKGGA